mmetsp:Transcript_18960/g.30573  ORF Transcript_18960/g.30573 Transcript_18960/m.30573 type:complete len:87 (+) Transcript_18960:255-515(+)
MLYSIQHSPYMKQKKMSLYFANHRTTADIGEQTCKLFDILIENPRPGPKSSSQERGEGKFVHQCCFLSPSRKKAKSQKARLALSRH